MTNANTAAENIKTECGLNFTAAHVGNFAKLPEIEMAIGDRQVKGKVFLKQFTDFTGMEISLTSIPAGKHTPFVHHHKQDEEAYIFIQGNGRMQVDDQIFDVHEGSVVRVAPPGKRAIGNNSDSPLVYICVQAKAGSLEQYTFEDGVRDDEKPKV